VSHIFSGPEYGNMLNMKKCGACTSKQHIGILGKYWVRCPHIFSDPEYGNMLHMTPEKIGGT